MEGVRFNWRGCISTGGGLFQLEGVRFKWRRCVSYGGGAFHMEGVFQLEEHSGFKGRGSTFTHAHSCAHVPSLRTMSSEGNLNPGSQTAGGAPARGGSGAPSTAGTPDSLRDEVLVSTSQLQQQLLNAVDRLERSRSSSAAASSLRALHVPQQPGQSHSSRSSLTHVQLGHQLSSSSPYQVSLFKVQSSPKVRMRSQYVCVCVSVIAMLISCPINR